MYNIREKLPIPFEHGDAWMTKDEGNQISKYVMNKHYLEVGTYHGYSLYRAFGRAKSITCVDHKKFPYPTSLGNSIKYLKMKSQKALKYLEDNFYEIILIDGCHTMPTILDDISGYWNKLKKNGYMMIHDYDIDGWDVKKAVNIFFKKEPEFIIDSLICFKKDE